MKIIIILVTKNMPYQHGLWWTQAISEMCTDPHIVKPKLWSFGTINLKGKEVTWLSMQPCTLEAELNYIIYGACQAKSNQRIMDSQQRFRGSSYKVVQLHAYTTVRLILLSTTAYTCYFSWLYCRVWIEYWFAFDQGPTVSVSIPFMNLD
jgi:hypothetical protein